MSTEYYNKLLGRATGTGNKRKRDVIVDDVADMELPLRKLPGFLAIPDSTHCGHALDDGLLAIEDRSEGEPEELEDIRGAEGLKDAVDKTLSHRWGPFYFSAVTRTTKQGRSAGTETRQWQVVCKYHRCPADPEGTNCTKTASYRSKEESLQRIRELRALVLAGRTCPSNDRLAHKVVPFRHLLVFTDSAMDEALAEGLEDEAWIQVPE